MRTRARLAAVIAISWTISAPVLASAQPLQVIGNHPVAGPICAGPLGPGPCAAVQQYILNHSQQQPSAPRVLPMPGAPGAGPAPIDARTAQLPNSGRRPAGRRWRQERERQRKLRGALVPIGCSIRAVRSPFGVYSAKMTT